MMWFYNPALHVYSSSIKTFDHGTFLKSFKKKKEKRRRCCFIWVCHVLFKLCEWVREGYWDNQSCYLISFSDIVFILELLYIFLLFHSIVLHLDFSYLWKKKTLSDSFYESDGCHHPKVALIVGAAQEVAVSQHPVQPAGPQVVLEHVVSTVDVGKTCSHDECHY